LSATTDVKSAPYPMGTWRLTESLPKRLGELDTRISARVGYSTPPPRVVFLKVGILRI
jgi:hypothetical protein